MPRGGLELALACHARICSLDDKTQLGLPEVQLGLLPGSGGTQRLPRLIGAPKALELMLTGRSLRAKQALKLGLVDDAVPYSILLQTALERVAKGRKARPPLPWQARLAGGPLGKSLLFHFVRKQTRAKTHGNYPATEKILDVVKTGLDQGSGNGYQAEANAFGELVMTPESAALRGLFFASTALKKEKGADAEPLPVRRVGILGGGLMGGGIANVTATRAGLPVRIKDVNHEGIRHALKYSWDLLEKKVRSRRLTVTDNSEEDAYLRPTIRGLRGGFGRRCGVRTSPQTKYGCETEKTHPRPFSPQTLLLPLSDCRVATSPEHVSSAYFCPVVKCAVK